MLDHEPAGNEMDGASEGREGASGESAPAPAAKRVRRRAASRPAGAPESSAGAAVAAAGAEAAQPGAADSGAAASGDAASADGEAAPPAKRAARKRATKKTAAAKVAAPAEETPEPARQAAAEQEAPNAQAAPAAQPTGQAEAAAETAQEPAAAPAASPRRTRKRAASRVAGAPAAESAPAAAAAEPAPEPARSPEPAQAETSNEASTETPAEAAEPAKPVANAKRTRKAGASKRAAKRAVAEPEQQPEQRSEAAAEPVAEPETPIVVVPVPDDLEDEAAAEQAEGETGDEQAATDSAAHDVAPITPAPAWTGNLFQAPVVPIAPLRAPAAAPAAAAAAAAAATPVATEAEDEEETEESAGSSAGSRRRRRRNRRGEAAAAAEAPAGRESKDAAGAKQDEDEGEQTEAQPKGGAQHPEALELSEDSSRRRRRRRRRQTAEDLASGGTDGSDDPPNTVVKVREPRQRRSSGSPDAVATEDDVMGLRGSVRLVAKQQRRREGRATRSRRAPIVTEAEFLARRESVERVMVVRQSAGRTQIGVLEDGVLVEHYVNRESSVSYVGNVYLGKVQNVLPSMEAAFVDINKGRNAVLYAGEVNFDAAGLSGQPRRIESALKSGQSVLVQVTKDPIGHKGARLTSQISLPGRFLVYIPGGSMMGISRKLPDTERARLKQILKKVVPEDGGVIVRTAAEGASEQELSQDVARLVAQWEEIERKAKTASAPALLSGEPDLTVRVVRDIFNEDFSKLIVSGDTAYKTVHEYLNGVAPELAERVEHWTSETDVFSVYRIEEQLAKALDRKVWLPSGGSLVIDRTEAMVVIDVNTGKFTGQGSSSLEETVTRNNLEAAEEIVRQLRLRDLGGIVVIDFIDMVLESNRDLVLRRLLECLGRDRTKHQVAEVTSLGLVQMTRKRVGQGLLEAFSEPCEHCNGRGVIVHTDPVEHSGRKPEQQGGGKQSKQQQQQHGGGNGNGGGGNGAGGNGGGNGAGGNGHDHGRQQAQAEESAAEGRGLSQDDGAGERPEETGEGRRSRRRRKAGRAATNEAGHEAATESAQDGGEAAEGADGAEARQQDEATQSSETAQPEAAQSESAQSEAATSEAAQPAAEQAPAQEAAPRATRRSRSARAAAQSPAQAPVQTATETAGAAQPEPASARQPEEASAEPAEPLNLKAHADDPDALEGAIADSGRPRRRARRAASRPAGAPSA